MEKFKKFCKLPALIISSLIFLASMISLIVVCTRPYSVGKYSYKETLAGTTLEAYYTLGSDGKFLLEVQSIILGDEPELAVSTGDYRVFKGHLFLRADDSSTYKTTMTIDAIKIIGEADGVKVEMVNKSARALKIASIVNTALFGVLAISSGVYIFLSHKKNKNAIVVESASEQVVEEEKEG